MKSKKKAIESSNNKITSIIICGVGGQGILLSSDILCTAAFLAGYDVKKSEIHGMAQRVGSVITHARFGKKVYSPLVEEGGADFILAFEKLEALRYSYFLRNNGTIIVNELQLPPTSVLAGERDYPANIIETLKKFANVDVIPAQEIALKLGNVRVANVVLLGGIARYLKFPEELWTEAIKENVKPQYLDLNIRAFKQGLSIP